ncbi:hypothetical protein QO002_005679 [Pararhizobium capsulatum DSM 1112]|uniref:Uncharacterized protein n=1 Tax=Pararhizobium capsulatum DSM 1112 TaxID=1121113 RepID=A0ABU0BYX8_9HYPH|nr:hypothetical protein [Pararhizobium capsulatum]MDQ0323473.1 hypothetical protein [Pararhizobium capsulatum DSM 1112]
MADIDDELRTLRSALRVLEEKNRRTGGDGYPLQIAQVRDMIAERERFRLDQGQFGNPLSPQPITKERASRDKEDR